MAITISRGSFVSTGATEFIPLRSGVSWMKVWNLTELAAANAVHGVTYDWTAALPANNGIVTMRDAGAVDVNMTTSAALAVGGFTLYDNSTNPNQAVVALTSISGALPPRVLVAATAGLADGMVVRLFDTAGGQQLGGMDFQITVADGTHFDLVNMPAIVAAAGPGTYRVISWSPFAYRPRRRYISAITQAASAVVTTTVDHGYTIGDEVRIYTNTDGYEAFGMTQMNGLIGKITATTAATFTVNIDSTAFDAFAFPLTAAVPFAPAIVVPVGEDAGNPLLYDATENTWTLGIQLAPGITSPAGTVGQVITWLAGTDFNI
jgi:hypothetical protein